MSLAIQNTRLDVRLTEEHKRIIEQAAKLLGQSISAFTVSTLIREAETVVERFSSLSISNRDRDLFIAALENPPKPNARLRKAFESHSRQVKSK